MCGNLRQNCWPLLCHRFLLCIIEEADDDVYGNAESAPQGVAE